MWGLSAVFPPKIRLHGVFARVRSLQSISSPDPYSTCTFPATCLPKCEKSFNLRAGNRSDKIKMDSISRGDSTVTLSLDSLLSVILSSHEKSAEMLSKEEDLKAFISRHRSLLLKERDAEVERSSLLLSNCGPRLLEQKGLALIGLGVSNITIGLGGKTCVQQSLIFQFRRYP